MNLVQAVLNGFSQVFLQENLIFGALILIGLAIASPTTLLFGLLGLTTSVMTAKMLGVKDAVINSGLYSFNGLLIGIVSMFFLKQTSAILISTVVLSALGALVFYLFSKNNIPAFTTPFVLAGWAILLVTRFLK